jgi:hypothetical protein
MNKTLMKLFELRILKRIYLERAGEPLLYNLVSIYHFIFSDFSKKIDYDLVPRQPYAFGIKKAFETAASEKTEKILLIEFGVASGGGLFNMAYIASKLSKKYHVDYEVIGFDTGGGMPPAIDYRDHPELYREGDFPPLNLNDVDLPSKTKMYYGDISTELEKFKQDIKDKPARIGFVSVDVDYYSSTLKCMEIFEADTSNFLSNTPIYFDDVNNLTHNDYCGELLAIREFNEKENSLRKICKMTSLRNWRIFKNAMYLDQMYFLHSFDHELRSVEHNKGRKVQVLTNPFT